MNLFKLLSHKGYTGYRTVHSVFITFKTPDNDQFKILEDSEGCEDVLVSAPRPINVVGTAA